MNHQTRLTDDSISAAFARRSVRGTPGDIRGLILAATLVTPQRQAGLRRLSPVPRWSAFRLIVASAAVAATVLAISLGVAGTTNRQPTVPPSLAPSPSPINSAPAELEPATDPATVFGEGTAFIADVAYTSNRFEPSVTFRASARTAGEAEGDVCPVADISSRTIVLAHPKACIADLRFIRPWAVDCGAAGDHPDADTLAAAILAIPAPTSMFDLGDLQTAGAVPAGMFPDRYQGRVIEVLRNSQLFRADLPDRDHCRLLPEPGSNDPVIEIRRDMSAILVLLDVKGELVVIRASVAGHDAASGAEAQSRGYAEGGADQLRHLLGLVNGIRFTP